MSPSKLSLLLGGAALLAASSEAAQAPMAFASSLDTVYQLSPYQAPYLNNQTSSGYSTWSGSVDDTPSGYMQNITGFGAAITDATVTAFNSLPKGQYKALLTALMDPSAGIGMSLMRHTIGASDLSTYSYSYDPTMTPDLKLANFGLQPAGRAMVKLLSDMGKVNPAMKLLGSVWSPPGWMKVNGVMLGNGTGNYLNMGYASQYATYFIDYIKKFAGMGVTVDFVTLQNEPLNSNPGYPTSYLSAENATDIIQNYLGPALKANKMTTEIWAYDHNTDVPSYPQTVLDGAGDYVNTVAWHCYANPLNWDVLTQFRANNTGVTQYMTECWVSPLTSWYQSVLFVLQPLQNWASGAIGWTLGTTTTLGPHLPGGCNTCRGIVEVDTAAGTYDLTMDYYFIGQFSKYLARGSRVLSTSGSYNFGGGSACEYTATMNADGSRTVVLYNGFGNVLYITLTFASGESWSGPLYQYSVTTWILPPTTG